MAEAQQLFQQALAVTEAAQTQAEESSASEDDWESSKLPCLLDCCLAVSGKGLHQCVMSLMPGLRIGWEQSMQHMQQQQKPAPLAVKRRNPKPSQLMQPSASVTRRQDEEGSEDSEEMTVPYDGLHLVECHNMTQYDTELKLEGFLQHLQWSTVAPVVRCVCGPADTAAHLCISCSKDAAMLLTMSASTVCGNSIGI